MRISDWNSDVCSSELLGAAGFCSELASKHRKRKERSKSRRLDRTGRGTVSMIGNSPPPAWQPLRGRCAKRACPMTAESFAAWMIALMRSEERRVGKEFVSTCRVRGSQEH